MDHDRHVDREESVAAGGQRELVDVHVVAIAGVDGADRLVLPVGDHALADSERRGGDAALPPGQHLAAAELLYLEVRGDVRTGELLEPDEVAVAVRDHRAAGADGMDLDRVVAVRVDDGGGKGSDEHAAARAAHVLVDVDARRQEVRLRDEVLELVGLLLLEVKHRLHRAEAGDRERAPHRLAVSDPDDQLDPLALCERPVGDEARPARARVVVHRAAVLAGHRAGDLHRADALRLDPEHADLGLRRGVRRALGGGDRELRVRRGEGLAGAEGAREREGER